MKEKAMQEQQLGSRRRENEMNLRLLLHAPTHLFIVIFLCICAFHLGIPALYLIFFASIIELIILSFSHIYYYRKGFWVRSIKIRYIEIAIVIIALGASIWNIKGF